MFTKTRLSASLALLVGGFFAVDKYFNYSAVTRSFKTFYVAFRVGLDYKLNFRPEKINEIESLHTRTANRIYSLCRNNGGLYIKFGQQIATVPVLPPAYVKLFKTLFDEAPSHPYPVVQKIIEKEFGKPVHELFHQFDEKPVASASIAQVHKAVLKNGETVAVKIQKPEIQTSIGFDLFSYVTLMYIVEKVFSLPVYSNAQYVSKNMRLETDFINEAKNSEKCQKLLNESNDESLKKSVFVPKVNWDLTSKVVLTTEWIEGISFGKLIRFVVITKRKRNRKCKVKLKKEKQ